MNNFIMYLKNYAKLALLLSLCVGVPAQGMSYVSYIKSFFVKETDSQRVQREEYEFCVALKKHDYDKAEKIFKGACDTSRVYCLQRLVEHNIRGLLPSSLINLIFEDIAVDQYLKNNRAQIKDMFQTALNVQDFPEIALRIFASTSKISRWEIIKPFFEKYKMFRGSRHYVDSLFDDFFSQGDIKAHDENAKELFLKTFAGGSYDIAFRIFDNSSEAARLECIKIFVNASINSLTPGRRLLALKISRLHQDYAALLRDGLKCDVKNINPTVKHLLFNAEKAENMREKFENDRYLNPLCTQVMAKEQELGQDYYTFVHGQRSAYYFPEKLYTFLWQLRKKRTVQDFFFPHVTDLISPTDAALERVQRNFLLNNHKYDADNRKKLLFMNYALFANAGNFGSNSASYVVQNANAAKGIFDLPVNEPFKKIGYEHIYNKFKDELEELGQQYNTKCSYGNLLFIAIPKDKIHKYAYLAATGGKRVPMSIEGHGDTTDIRVIMHTLLHEPEKIKSSGNPLALEYSDIRENNTDMLEFCLIMTQTKGGLDPDTGIKIFPILSGEPARLAELQKKEDALFAKIKAAIEQEENAKATAANRANAIVNHLVLPSKDAGVMPVKTMARIHTIMGHIQPQQKIN